MRREIDVGMIPFGTRLARRSAANTALKTWPAMLLAILATSCAMTAPPCAPPGIARVDIHSSWSGLASITPADLVIVQCDTLSQRGRRRGDPQAVAKLIEAIDPLSSPSIATEYDVPQAWHDQQAEAAFDEDVRTNYPGVWAHVTPAKRELFLSAFRNKDLVSALLQKQRSSVVYDDYPRVEALVTMATGETIRLRSEEQRLFMIPWTVERSGVLADLSFNPEIGVAIAALIPAGSANRGRLRGDGLRGEIASLLLWDGIRPEWGMLDSKQRLGNHFDRVASRFEIVASEIGHIGTVDVSRDDHTWSWIAKLRRADLPPNLTIGLDLPFANERLRNLDAFLLRIDAFIAQVITVPWLASYLETHPAARVELRFVDDRSFSPRAAEWYLQHAPRRAALTRDTLATAAFLEVTEPMCFSRWLIFPNAHALLWEAALRDARSCPNGVLGRRINRATPPDFVGSAQIGLMFDSNGEVIP